MDVFKHVSEVLNNTYVLLFSFSNSEFVITSDEMSISFGDNIFYAVSGWFVQFIFSDDTGYSGR